MSLNFITHSWSIDKLEQDINRSSPLGKECLVQSAPMFVTASQLLAYSPFVHATVASSHTCADLFNCRLFEFSSTSYICRIQILQHLRVDEVSSVLQVGRMVHSIDRALFLTKQDNCIRFYIIKMARSSFSSVDGLYNIGSLCDLYTSHSQVEGLGCKAQCGLVTCRCRFHYDGCLHRNFKLHFRVIQRCEPWFEHKTSA